jgi:hypothetical protein
MKHPVFISYAQQANAEQALALHEALGGQEGLAFLDKPGVQPESRFSQELAAALLTARVVVVFASEEYFRSRFCLWELNIALEPLRKLAPEATDVERSAALEPVLIVRPGSQPADTRMELPYENYFRGRKAIVRVPCPYTCFL